jgi:hypothetical protein
MKSIVFFSSCTYYHRNRKPFCTAISTATKNVLCILLSALCRDSMTENHFIFILKKSLLDRLCQCHFTHTHIYVGFAFQPIHHFNQQYVDNAVRQEVQDNLFWNNLIIHKVQLGRQKNLNWRKLIKFKA